jgi:hypothetical protein
MVMEMGYRKRAEYSVLHAYQSSGYPVMNICEPEKWPSCPAREVALHAIEGYLAGHMMHESWINFPGGWPRFLDFLNAAAEAANIEQGESVIDMFSLTMANEVLKAEGGK